MSVAQSLWLWLLLTLLLLFKRVSGGGGATTTKSPDAYRSNFLPYDHPECLMENGIQYQCCSTDVTIGYVFPFACEYQTSFSASTTGASLLFENVPCTEYDVGEFSISLFVPGNISAGPAALFPDALLPNAGIGQHTVALDGSLVTVVEWSGIFFGNYKAEVGYERYGTVQAWLFPNGTIGAIYHSRGLYFGSRLVICYDGDCSIYHNHTDALASEAFLLVPDPTDDCSGQPQYTQRNWGGAPDVCLNVFEPLPRNEENSYYYVHKDYPGALPDYDDPQDAVYTPLTICPSDSYYLPSPSESASESQMDFLYDDWMTYSYCAGVPHVQENCYTYPYDIGYPFKYGCDYITQIEFGTEEVTLFISYNFGGTLYDVYLSLVANDVNVVILNKGGPAMRSYRTDDDENTRVLEISDVAVYVRGSDKVAKLGTIQVWFFRNGTLGLIYHLTGQFFPLGPAYYASVDKKRRGVPLMFFDGVDLRHSEAYLISFTDLALDCCGDPLAIYNDPISVWKNPPNVCLNPVRSFAGDDGSDDYHEDLLHGSEDSYGDSDYLEVKQIDYVPLEVCPADKIAGSSPFDRLAEPYAECTQNFRQSDCTTSPLEIGYVFPLKCENFTHVAAETFRLQLRFYEDDVNKSIVFYEGPGEYVLGNRGGIGSYMRTIPDGFGGTETVRVFEFSDVAWFIGYEVTIKVGTVQYWLFRNGSLGVIWHLTGDFFLSEYNIYSIWFNVDGPVVIPAGDYETEYFSLRDAEAFVFESNTTCGVYNRMRIWENPPDVCLNNARKFNADSADDALQFTYGDAEVYNNPQMFAPNGVPYVPLSICPVDLYRGHAPFSGWANEWAEYAACSTSIYGPVNGTYGYINDTIVNQTEAQMLCITEEIEIGYVFPFNCRNVTRIVADTFDMGISLQTDDDYIAYISAYDPDITGFATTIINKGGVGVRTYYSVVMPGRTMTRVIEFSGIVLIISDMNDVVKVGTVQFWLFQNGTLGVVFHLTGVYFGHGMEYCSYNNDCEEISFIDLKESPAFLLNTDLDACTLADLQSVCYADLDGNSPSCPWPYAPDFCLNPVREYGEDGSDFEHAPTFNDPDITETGELWSMSGLDYTPLSVCPADDFTSAPYHPPPPILDSQSSSPSESPLDFESPPPYDISHPPLRPAITKQTFSIVSSIAQSIVLVALFAFVAAAVLL